MKLLTITLLMLVAANAQNDYPEWISGTFPDDFEWGVATAAYQIEGGWNADGKGQNIWDTFTHTEPSPIFDGTSGDIACDSYNKYEEDVQLIKTLGADYYRFSVSWARVLPTGKIDGGVNEAGVAYYNKLINNLIANNIEPFITMYHWDLPQALQDEGGWLNETVVTAFEGYADLLYARFGDRVKRWITINEPWVVCVMGFSYGVDAPGIREPATAPYRCSHNIIKSHAKAYRLYEKTYKAIHNGTVGITLDSGWFEPRDPNNASDVEAAQRAQLFRHGWYAYPIFKGGDYPVVMKDIIQRKSDEDDLPFSRLPVFTDDEKLEINGSADFMGFNHYTTDYAQHVINSDRSFSGDQDTHTFKDPEWSGSGSDWLKHVPWGFRKLLVWFKDTYDNPLVYVTENGFSDSDDVGLDDTARITYYREYINEMLKAVTIDNCNVKSYTAWSLMDNFEWRQGYTERFGVYWVNFTDPQRTRTPKKSAAELQKIFNENGFPNSSSKIVISVITYMLGFVAVMYGIFF